MSGKSNEGNDMQFILRCGFCGFVLGLLALTAWTPLYSVTKDKLVAETPILVSKLDAEDVRERLTRGEGGVPLGEIALGKVAERGRAKVKTVVNRPEDQAPYAVRFDGDGEVEIELPKDRLENQDAVTFYAFRYRPAIGGAPSYVDLGGAILGYRRMPEHSHLAEVVALKGVLSKKTADSDWIRTGITCPIRDGRVRVHGVFTARTDAAAGVWDLYYYEKPVLTGIPYSAKAEKFQVRSAGAGRTTIGTISISDGNPLFRDDNVDGIPDSLASRMGVQRRHDLVPGTNRTLLDHYMGTGPDEKTESASKPKKSI